jgi:protein-tyrosine-phosphatase
MPERTRVLFVCLHASAKSLIAAEYFNKRAAERGLPFHALSAGTDPDKSVPPHVIAGLRGDGYDVSDRRPLRLTRDLAAPTRIAVSFEPDLTEYLPQDCTVERWSVPAVSDDYAISRDAITARVDRLIAELRATMPLREIAVIEFPDAAQSAFDHGAFDPKTRRVFVAHTRRDRIEVIDHDHGRHIATLDGFPEAAGVVAEAGQVLVTNRGRAELAWVDARTLKALGVFETGVRPNGVAMVAHSRLAVVACIGDPQHAPKLQAIDLVGGRRSEIELPGQPRWCVTDSGGERIFLAIREPSMLLVARLPELTELRHWPLPVTGAHGLDIDHEAGLLYAACDEGALVAIDAISGEVRGIWSLDGGPDATFFNPASGLVHVAIGKPGLIQTIDPRTDEATRTPTALGAKTTALAPPNRLYVFSPAHRGALVLAERGT